MILSFAAGEKTVCGVGKNLPGPDRPTLRKQRVSRASQSLTLRKLLMKVTRGVSGGFFAVPR